VNVSVAPGSTYAAERHPPEVVGEESAVVDDDALREPVAEEVLLR
jgi:hypothetical protein